MIAVFKLESVLIFLMQSLLNVEFAKFDGIELLIFVMSVKEIRVKNVSFSHSNSSTRLFIRGSLFLITKFVVACQAIST